MILHRYQVRIHAGKPEFWKARSRGTDKNEISLARMVLATACPGSHALWARSFTWREGKSFCCGTLH